MFLGFSLIDQMLVFACYRQYNPSIHSYPKNTLFVFDQKQNTFGYTQSMVSQIETIGTYSTCGTDFHISLIGASGFTDHIKYLPDVRDIRDIKIRNILY